MLIPLCWPETCTNSLSNYTNYVSSHLILKFYFYTEISSHKTSLEHYKDFKLQWIYI